MNCIILTGNLTAKPEQRTSSNGKSHVIFTIAVKREYARDGMQNVDFIPCIVWGKTADYVANYGDKGSRATVRGALNISSYKKDGETKYLTQINCDKVELGMKKQESTSPLAQPDTSSGFTEVEPGDDLPF